MIWLTWRQFRPQAITAAAVLIAVGITLAVTGPHLAADYSAAGLNTCHADCGALASNFTGEIKGGKLGTIFYGGIVALYLVPALIGLFWGAPLIARELETGTQRIAWNQSVTRTRWTVIKLVGVGLAAIATAGLLSLMIGWWASPIDHALQDAGGNGMISDRLSPLVFGTRGIAPMGYAAFAFALGVTAGVLIRRTIPAMAVTLALFAAVQVLVPAFVRPNLISPDQVTAPINVDTAGIEMMANQGSEGTMTLTANHPIRGAWILSARDILPSGQVFGTVGPKDTALCTESNPQPCNTWLASLHLRQLITYQPASRFWPLQWLETAIYLILATGLGCICAWQVSRRRA
jgi:hypothetical protein